mmetsp:Transcript_40965/g.107601  ORF Transcript_40965/g.107601 Transcript_40965/m.107601 type:complete len:268 (+) Transcript_40965:178-981(+)
MSLPSGPQRSHFRFFGAPRKVQKRMQLAWLSCRLRLATRPARVRRRNVRQRLSTFGIRAAFWNHIPPSYHQPRKTTFCSRCKIERFDALHPLNQNRGSIPSSDAASGPADAADSRTQPSRCQMQQQQRQAPIALSPAILDEPRHSELHTALQPLVAYTGPRYAAACAPTNTLLPHIGVRPNTNYYQTRTYPSPKGGKIAFAAALVHCGGTKSKLAGVAAATPLYDRVIWICATLTQMVESGTYHWSWLCVTRRQNQEELTRPEKNLA